MKNLIINTQNLKESRKQIDKLSKEKKKVIVQGKDINFNRKILENEKVDMLILSHTDKKDKLKERDSGLNQVLCKIAKQNSITFAIDLDEIKQAEDKKQKAKIWARIAQNIKLIKKYKNKFKLLSFKDKHQARAFLLTLGLPTNMVKEAIN